MNNTELVKSQSDKLIQILEAVEADMQKAEGRQKIMEEYDFKLREREKQLTEKEQTYIDRELRIAEEKRYMDGERIKIKAKEMALAEDRKTLEKEREIIGIMDAKREELRKQEDILNAKIEKSKDIDKRIEDLKHLQALIDKSTAIDRERKVRLDERENALHVREAKLQQQAEAIGG